MPDRDEVLELGYVPKLLAGATNYLVHGLGVTEDDRVTIICDKETRSAAAQLIAALELIPAKYSVFVLENHARRPAEKLPPLIALQLRQSTASAYIAKPQPGEYPHRRAVVKTTEQTGLRHAHTPGLTPRILEVAITANYEKVARLNELLIEKLTSGAKIRMQSTSGTDITSTFDPKFPAVSVAGVIEPGTWQNIPNGEICLHPSDTEGVYVCDGHLPHGARYVSSELLKKPWKLHIEDNRLVKITGGVKDQVEIVQQTIDEGVNVDLVGMLCIGTNLALIDWTGHPIVDHYTPGGYFVFGETLEMIELPWEAKGHIHFIGSRVSVSINDEPIISAGQFVKDILEKIG